MRLGLVIAEIGEKNNIKVTDEQMSAALVERARQLPGREQEVWDYYRNNPNALASLRAPIFEEKVVDFLVELADVTEKQRVARGAVQGGRDRGAAMRTSAMPWRRTALSFGGREKRRRTPCRRQICAYLRWLH